MPLSAPAGRKQWAYLDSSTLTKRRYIAIDITIGSFHYVWIDIEQRRKGECSVGLLKHTEKIENEALALILRNLSRLKGVWDGKSGSALKCTEIQFERVLHTWDCSGALSKIIKTKILG
jgi:hypothetical protein